MTLNDEEIQELKDIFEKYDKDGDGNIINKELGQMLKDLGKETTQEELQEMINEMDIDGNGSIQFNEFLNVIQKKISSQYSKNEIEEAFSFVDQQKDRITKLGLQKIFQELGEDLRADEIDEMFQAVTKNKRDYVTSDELSKFLSDT